MENSKLSDVKGKELVTAGHAFAKAIGMDTPLIDIAKMVSELATRLDCALVRGDALAAENAALKHGAEYFMYGPDCGFERFDSQDAAIKAANEMIDDYREDAADGWCDEVDQVCFGIVMSYARQHDVQLPSEDNGFLGSVNYMMSAPEAPATDAYLNSVRAEGVDYVAEAIGEKCAELKIGSKDWKALKSIVFMLGDFSSKLRAGDKS